MKVLHWGASQEALQDLIPCSQVNNMETTWPWDPDVNSALRFPNADRETLWVPVGSSFLRCLQVETGLFVLIGANTTDTTQSLPAPYPLLSRR